MKTILIACALIAASASAMADNAPGAYISGSIGMSVHDTPGLDDKAGFKLAVGYMLNKHFGVEAGYANTKSSGGDGEFSAEASADTVYGAVLGAIPLNDSFSLYGKLGLGHSSVDVEVSMGPDSSSGSGSDTELMLGLGAAWKISPSFAVIGEYDRYDEGMALWSVGGKFSF